MVIAISTSFANDKARGDGNSSGKRWTDFELAMDAAVVVAAEIAGQRRWALLDTGAAISALDVSLAANLRLQPLAPLSLQSDLSSARAVSVQSPPIWVAGHRSPLAAIAAVNLSYLAQTVGRPISLILGQDAFGAALLELDMPRRRLAIAFQSEQQIKPATPLSRDRLGRRRIEVMVEGGRPAWATVDLGSSNAVMVSQAFATAHGLTKNRRISSAATATLGGVSISTSCRLSSLEIGGAPIRGALAEVFSDWIDADTPINIGLPILERFRLTFDFHCERIWLDPVDVDRPFSSDRSGLGLAFQGESLMVVHVAKGGPAERAGWRIGERITKIDGAPVDAGYPSSPAAGWRRQSAGREVRLTMADGALRRLVLEDYI